MTLASETVRGIVDRVRTPHKSESLVFAPTHRAGDWNSHAVDIPFVFTHQGRLGMTIVGWDGVGYQTGLSWSDDACAWSEPELVFGRDAGTTHRRYNSAMTALLRDHRLDGAGELVQVDGYFIGTWHAYPSAGYEVGSAVIGFARSTDLLNWEEFGPVIRPDDGGEWERGGLYKSWLIRTGGRYWLFYNAKNQPSGSWREQTGAAWSDDLVTWHRASRNPLLRNGGAGAGDEMFASDPCVLSLGDLWLMFYFGLAADGHARDYLAVSTDLLDWQKLGEPLIDIGPAGSIDATHAHKPAVISHGGVIEHYYCAVAPLETPIRIGDSEVREMRGIAVARSTGAGPATP